MPYLAEPLYDAIVTGRIDLDTIEYDVPCAGDELDAIGIALCTAARLYESAIGSSVDMEPALSLAYHRGDVTVELKRRKDLEDRAEMFTSALLAVSRVVGTRRARRKRRVGK